MDIPNGQAIPITVLTGFLGAGRVQAIPPG